MDFKLIRFSELVAKHTPRTLAEEEEYRRGYVDDWVQAVDAMHDLMFKYRMPRQEAYDLAWDHGLYGPLHDWKLRAEDGQFGFPPAHPKPKQQDKESRNPVPAQQ